MKQTRTTKRKILALLDTPTCATGFAQVAKNVLWELYQTGLYDIDIIGLNHYGDPYDLGKYPYYIVPANAGGHLDFYGMTRLANVLTGNDPAIVPPFDILFTINDIQIFEMPLQNQMTSVQMIHRNQEAYKKLPKEYWFKWIAYFPVDSKLKENWVDTALAPDYPVVYTQYGMDQMNYWRDLKALDRVNIIPHGVNTKDFHLISPDEKKEFREAFFQGEVKENDFLISIVSRNQPRKDIMRSLQIFKELKKLLPEAKLYMNMAKSDAGGNIEEMALEIGLKRDEYFLPEKFDPISGLSLETVNKIYNISDALLTTTLGEGWGFILTEGMATKTIVVAPDNTSVTEIFGGTEAEFSKDHSNFRGVPMKCGSSPTEWTMIKDDYGRLRPLTNVEDGVKKLMWVYENPDKVEQIKENGYKWVTEMTWKNVCKDWIRIFNQAFEDLERERNAPIVDVKKTVAKFLKEAK